MGASKLIVATKLHGQFVYDALTRLEELGLARHMLVAGRRRFTAAPPTQILSILEAKRVAARSLVADLESHVPDSPTARPEVYEGRDAFIAHELALMEIATPGSELLILGGGGSLYIETLGRDASEHERLRVEKDIHIRYLSPTGQDNYLKIMSQSRKHFTYRILPHLVPGLVDQHIWPEISEFLVFGATPVAFVYKNAQVAESQRQYFDFLWALSS